MGAGLIGHLRGADFPPTKAPFLPLPPTPRLPDFKAGQMTAGERGTPRPLMRDTVTLTSKAKAVVQWESICLVHVQRGFDS